MKNLILIAIFTFTLTFAASGQSIVGTWRTGGMSTTGERNTVTGSVTPSNGNSQQYTFYANGKFEYIGYLKSTMYGSRPTFLTTSAVHTRSTATV